MELLNVWAGALLAVGRSCLLEANFNPALGARAFRRLAEQYVYQPIQINLSARPEVLCARWQARADARARHPGHLDPPIDPTAIMPTTGRLEPLDIGGLVIELDTSTFTGIDLNALVARINAHANVISFAGPKEA